MNTHIKRIFFVLLLLASGLSVMVLPVSASAPSGAIFTTLSDGTEVNLNLFPSKEDVYLDGGPGPGAPAGAAGLDDGTYVFQITNPSGKTLLSTDKARCRQFTVVGGLINSVVAQPDGCQHLTGIDIDHGAFTVQMMPYKDTNNNGGVYKAWVVRVADYLLGCQLLGVPAGQELEQVDCGYTAGDLHGFVPGNTKTDNFKIATRINREIDTRFFNEKGQPMDGFSETWIDTLGGSNRKWSYYQPTFNEHIAHIEAIENGTHQIQIDSQPGCTVSWIHSPSGSFDGPGTVSVTVAQKDHDLSVYIDVHCITTQ